MMSDFEITKLNQIFIFIWFRLQSVLRYYHTSYIIFNELVNASMVGGEWVVILML